MKNLNSINWEKGIHGFAARAPKPFPGTTPTRWYVRFRYLVRGKYVTYCYRGKPCSYIANYVMQLRRNYNGELFVIEFDRGGAVMEGISGVPHSHGLPVSNWNYDLAEFYYPFSAAVDAAILSPWMHPMFRKRVKFEKKEWACYAPFENLHLAEHVARVEAYKKWLIKTRSKLLI